MQQTDPAWLMALKETLDVHQDMPEAKFAQLATLDANSGRPANRTLVFRRFEPPGIGLLFTTDRRSDKVAEIQSHPFVELCWWFPRTREQFRIAGRAGLTDANAVAEADGEHLDRFEEARIAIWKTLKEGARRSFAWPEPGRPYVGPSLFEVAVPELIPSHFALLVLVPDQVDHLQLEPDPHVRMLHKRTDDRNAWVTDRINP